MKTSVLITGASGFIGQQVLPFFMGKNEYALFTQFQNHIIDKKKTTVHEVYASFPSKLEEIENVFKNNKIDVIIHLANLAHVKEDKNQDDLSKSKAYQVNVEGSKKLLELFLKYNPNGLFIYFSSIKAIGEESFDQAFNEQTPLAPSTLYGEVKYQAELQLKQVIENHSSPLAQLIILRPPLIYSKNPEFQLPGNLNLLVKCITYRIPLPFSKIKNKRSLLELEDIAPILHHLIQKKENLTPIEEFNLSSGPSLSTHDIIKNLENRTNKKALTIGLPASLLTIVFNVLQLLNIKGLKQKLISNLEVDSSKIKHFMKQ